MSTIEELLAERINALEARLRRLENVELGPQFVPLTTPLTSTAWDGDAFSDVAATVLDLSAVFGAPAGIKAVYIKAEVKDSAAASALYALFGPSTTGLGNIGTYSVIAKPHENNVYAAAHGVVPCDANGDIAYRINASGVNTLNCVLEIWGYWGP